MGKKIPTFDIGSYSDIFSNPMFSSPDGEKWYEQVGYADAKDIIRDNFKTAATSFIAIGYYLKHIKDKKMYEDDGYKDIWECAKEEFGLSQSTASRYMKMCNSYSVGGDSPLLDEKYSKFNKSQLQEMLSFTEEEKEKITPDMKVLEIRKIQEKDINVDGNAIGEGITGQMEIHDYPEVLPEEKADDIYAISHKLESLDLAECIEGKKFIEDVPDKHDNAPFVTKLQECLKENEEELLSPYGLAKSVYPEDSLISMEGCGCKHSCFCCDQECEIRQKDRYCRYAPLGNPFSCTTISMLEEIREEIGERCQFIDQEKAYHAAGANEPVPCCKECKEFCEYQCHRSSLVEMKILKETEQLEIIDVEPEKIKHYVNLIPVVEDVESEIKQYPNSLTDAEICALEKQINEEKETLATMADYWKENQPDTYTIHSTIQLACELLLQHGKSDREQDAYDSDRQPELPILKNMDAREDFVNDYESWPVWCKNELTEETFYRYNLPDQSAIVVRHYPRYSSWQKAGYAGKDLYLLKPGYKYFKDAETNMTTLREHLKEIQKK